MKHLYLFILFLITTNQSLAQKYNGKVVDGRNSIELEGVMIADSDGYFSTISNNNGDFYIPKSGNYQFSKEGFVIKTSYLDKSLFNIIELANIVEKLSEVIITSNNFQNKLNKLPSAISVINSEIIKQKNNINIAQLLNSVSGIYTHNGTLTTNRITIRGIGSRNPFGTSKIRAYYEDIPLTNGSGSSTIEDIEISTLGQIEILKGPSSSIYGSGLGGTIQLIPSKGKFNKQTIFTNYTFGSFGLQKYLLQANLGNAKNKANITYSNLHSDGYRENNETNRQTITLASKHFINNSNKITFIGNYIDLKAFIPSSLNEDDYLNNPSSAAYTWKRSKGYEDYKKGMFGLGWEHFYNNNTKQKTSIFSSFLDSYEPRPFNILNEKTNGFGLRTRVLSKLDLFEKSYEWTLGAEIFLDSNSIKTFENLYNDYPPETGSVKGDLLSSFKEKRSYFNLFFDSNYQLSGKTNLSFGLNINTTYYTLSDYFDADDTNFSGKYTFNTIASPKFGLTYDISKNAILYASISHGFSPPSLEETLLPDGLVNTEIKPESGWNYEIGGRGELLNDKLYFDIALFKMNVKNLLVARRTSDDQYIGVNAGETKYNGLELVLNFRLLNSKNLSINFNNSIAFNDFKFEEFIDDNENFSGNDLTGVPKSTFNSSLNFESIIGAYLFLNYNYVGEIPITDDNSIYSKYYQLFNAKIGFKSNPKKKFQFDVFLNLNNIFNEKYASMLLINASSFGGNAPRYYYPGEPSNYYAGINLKYNFIK